MRKKTILLVEDEEVIRRLCGRLLSSHGFELLLAENVQQGLFIVENKSLDLLITDLRLPDGNGVEVIRFFKEKFPQQKVIVITGSLTPNERLEGSSYFEEIKFFAKPFEPPLLEAAVVAELSEK